MISTPAMLWDSFSFAATGPDSAIRFPELGAAVSVTGGSTVFDLGETGTFDLDGAGNMEISIADGSSLEIIAGRVDTGAEVFGGTFNVAGTFHIEQYGPSSNRWTAGGAINMDGGAITGRHFANTGVLSGRGTIESFVFNDGLVEAVGGALFFDYLDFDGVDLDIPGVVRAEQGDIVVTRQDTGAYLPSTADIFVGNGEGVQEVFEMNGGLLVMSALNNQGLLSLDGGSHGSAAHASAPRLSQPVTP